MHLKATDEEASNVEAVFVNKKRVLNPFEFDTEEGWVDSWEPKVENIDMDMKEAVDMGEIEWTLHRLTGKVEVFFEEGTKIR
jgi:hypothetical protein